MNARRTLFALLVLMATGHLSFTATRTERPAAGADPEALARKLVGQCAGVRENNIVLISGGARDLELLEDIAVNVRKLGAHPLVTIESDRMVRRMYDDVPATYDSQTPRLDLKLAELMDAAITVEFGETEGLLAGVPPDRLAIRGKAAQPVGDLILERGVRQVNLGNGLYPTAALATRFGVPQEDLSRIFWDGVNVDYTKLQSTGETVKAALAGGKEVHITSPHGTDLRVQVEGRPVLVSDGVISAADVKMGGAACETWLPAGEVYLAPVPGTAEGKIVVDRQEFQGKEIEGLTLVFRAGKLSSMTARSGIGPLEGLYGASGPGKELFGVVDIGINPNVHIPRGSRMQAWMAAGMVTVGFGNNTWAGGENNAPFALYSFLAGASLKVDGKVVVDNGALRP